jgi:hypothetical protein
MIANPSALLGHADCAPDNAPKGFIIVNVHFGKRDLREFCNFHP